MDDASNAVVMHGILPFLIGTEIAKLERVSASWQRAIRNREKFLFQLALNRERSSKTGDFSSAGSDLAITISSKDIYKHRHRGAMVRLEAEQERRRASLKATERQEVERVSLMCLLSYVMLLADEESSALLAFICTLIVSMIAIPPTLWGIYRGGVFSLISMSGLFLFVPSLRPLIFLLAPLAVGTAPQVACLVCFTFNRAKTNILGLVFLGITLLELQVAYFVGFQFPIAVYWLPSLLLCFFRTAPVVFACGSLERGSYRTAIAATLGYVLLEYLFAIKFLPFFWLQYYATAGCFFCVWWAWMCAKFSLSRHPRVVALFTLMFPMGFQAWYRVGIPLCPAVAFFLRVLPFLVPSCLYLLMIFANTKCVHVRIVAAVLWLVVGGIEATWALSGVSVQSMTNSCTALFQDTLLAHILVE